MHTDKGMTYKRTPDGRVRITGKWLRDVGFPDGARVGLYVATQREPSGRLNVLMAVAGEHMDGWRKVGEAVVKTIKTGAAEILLSRAMLHKSELNKEPYVRCMFYGAGTAWVRAVRNLRTVRAQS